MSSQKVGASPCGRLVGQAQGLPLPRPQGLPGALAFLKLQLTVGQKQSRPVVRAAHLDRARNSLTKRPLDRLRSFWPMSLSISHINCFSSNISIGTSTVFISFLRSSIFGFNLKNICESLSPAFFRPRYCVLSSSSSGLTTIESQARGFIIQFLTSTILPSFNV